MPDSTGNAIAAGEIQAGDHLRYLFHEGTGDDWRTFTILEVRDSAEFPGFVEVTEADDWKNRWWPRQRGTRRFPKDRLVATRA